MQVGTLWAKKTDGVVHYIHGKHRRNRGSFALICVHSSNLVDTWASTET